MIDDRDPRIFAVGQTIEPLGSVRIGIDRRLEDLTLLTPVIFAGKRATNSILGRDQPDLTVSCGEQQLIIAWHSLFKDDREGRVCS
jgi:hypothetical protein